MHIIFARNSKDLVYGMTNDEILMNEFLSRTLLQLQRIGHYERIPEPDIIAAAADWPL